MVFAEVVVFYDVVNRSNTSRWCSDQNGLSENIQFDLPILVQTRSSCVPPRFNISAYEESPVALRLC